jgi:ribosomal protein S8
MFIKNLPFSSITIYFLKCLLSLGFIHQFYSFKVKTPFYYPALLCDITHFINLTIKIKKYIPIIKKIKILSTSSKGFFVNQQQLKNILQKNLTFKYILHTPKYGLIDGENAIKFKTGGELICVIYS